MTAEFSVLDRIADRLVRTLSVGGPDQLRAPFTVAEIIQSLVPYRTYRHELGVDTLQDYEHAVLELLAGERGWLICDAETVAVVRKELESPDPDTALLRRLHKVEVRMGAIRMPVHQQVRQPIARADEDARESGGHVRSLSSDAVAIGDAMAREDALDAPALTTPDVTPEPVPEVVPPPPEAVVSASPEPDRAPAAVAAPVTDTIPLDAASLPSALFEPPPPAAPLQGVSGVTLATADTLARITPLSTPTVYGEPLEFRGLRHAPVDVGGVIFLFGMIARELGFHVEAMMGGFPRCDAKRQLGPGRWQRLRIDFEIESRHFRDAGRNPGACDLLVCWRDTWPDRPRSLDVLALERVIQTLPSKE